MSKFKYAVRVRCDWPDCTTEGEVTLSGRWPYRELPQGWTDLKPGLNMRQMHGIPVEEFCPEHSGQSIAQLALIFTVKERTSI